MERDLSGSSNRRPWIPVALFLGFQLVLLGAFLVLGTPAATIVAVSATLSAGALALVLLVGAPHLKRQHDVIESKVAELAAQHELLRNIAELSPVGIVVTAPDGSTVFANPAVRTILGIAEDEVPGLRYDDPSWQAMDLTGEPLDATQMPTAIAGAIGAPVTDTRFWIVTRLGERRVVSVNASPLHDDAGEVTGVITTLLDVTSRQKALSALHESERLLHTSMDSMMEGCQILGFDWTYLYLNAAAQGHNRRPNEELMGRRYADMWPGIEQTEVYALIEACLTERTPSVLENEFTFPDGRQGWFDLRIQPVPEGALILSSDITQRKRAQRKLKEYQQNLERTVLERTAELQAANEELDAAIEEVTAMNEELDTSNEELQCTIEELDSTNSELQDATRAKSRFLASMSHELRTPLNSIIGFSGILANGMAGELTEEQGRQIEMIRRSGNRLLELINGVLDLSRVEAGGVEIHLETFDACDIVREVAETVRPLAQAKGLTLDVFVPHDELRVQTDPGRLRQILLNLVGNAIKFTHAGSVEMGVDHATTNGVVRFSVTDTGPGIDPEDRARVFSAFERLESEESPPPDGTGLGLAISREYAHLMGGEILLDSTVGQGSRFTLVIPSMA